MSPAPDISDDPAAAMRRGILLFQQGRHKDASEWFGRALEQDPENGSAFAYLALCQAQREGESRKAIETARQAVRLDPENAFFRGVLAVALLDASDPSDTRAVREALACAKEAVALDADSVFARTVLAHAHLKLRDYPAAEESARAALALDTASSGAAHVLSVALLAQRKDDDLRSLVEWQLAENPEDDTAHANAGLRALHEGRHAEANRHFREALRLNPGSVSAREGLIESFRARSLIYRSYLQFNHAMRRLGEKNGRWILFAGFAGYSVLRQALSQVNPALAGVLVGAWLLFALWTFLARGVGSLMMLFDPFARMAVRAKERWEGIVVGGLVIAALSFAVAGLVLPHGSGLYLALLCALTAVPSASYFSNDHPLGKWLYGAAALVAGVCLLLVVGCDWAGVSGPVIESLGGVALGAGVATTWARFFGAFYR